LFFFFFFQAEDGIRDGHVTGVQKCALPISFQPSPDTTAYTAEKPRVPLNERNPKEAATAARSGRMDFSQEDRIDDDELNDILWSAIRGKSTPPPPTRSYFSN